MLVNSVRGYLRNQTKLIAGSYTPSVPDKARVALTSSDDGIPQHIERLLLIIEELTEQIQDADNDLHQRLMTVPGVGPVTATRFVATVDMQNRFRNAHLLESYLGLTLGERGLTTLVERRLRR